MEQRSYQNRNVRRNRRRKANANRFQIRMQKKLVVLFLIILLAFIGLSVKLIYINKVDGERYKKQILSQQEYDSKTLPYKRGEIVDANGTKLAYSEKVYNLIIDAKAINNSKKEDALSATLQALDQYFDLDINAISNYISQNASSQYYVAAKHMKQWLRSWKPSRKTAPLSVSGLRKSTNENIHIIRWHPLSSALQAPITTEHTDWRNITIQL